MKRFFIGALIASLAGAGQSSLAYSSKELGFVHDTHNQLTTKAINETGGPTYPDLNKFQGAIISGGSTEGIISAGAHRSPDGQTVWWYGNEQKWIDDLLKQYKTMNFSQAYKELGFVIHLVEDFQVPAHQTVTFHGLSTLRRSQSFGPLWT